jgi:hypothetical protein
MNTLDTWDWIYIFLFYAVLQVLWTIIVRTLPDLLGKSITSRIELKNNQELEKLKSSLEEDIEGVKANWYYTNSHL